MQEIHNFASHTSTLSPMRLLPFLLGLLLAAPTLAQNPVYLAPDGSDDADGSAAAPFRTLGRALRPAYEGNARDTLYIIVKAGTYTPQRPVTITRCPARPVVIQGERGRTIVSGGLGITGWEDCGGGIYRAFVPEMARYGFAFEQFFVGDRRATPARTPNDGWFTVSRCTETAHVPGTAIATYATQEVFLRPEDFSRLSQQPAHLLTDMRVRLYHKWDVTEKHVAALHRASASLLVHGAGMKPSNPIGRGTRCVLQGFRGALDSPGEWWADRREGYVYYLPREDEDLRSVACTAPALSQWLIVRGRPGAPVRGIEFRDLIFRHTARLLPDRGEEPQQAASEAPAAIELTHASDIRFTRCTMEHTGAYALWMKQGCRDNVVQQCLLADLGAGGIKIGMTAMPLDSALVTARNTVDNCIITDGGHVMPCGAGVAIFHSADNRVTHCDISHLSYSGISVGWTWGYNHTPGKQARVMRRDGSMPYQKMDVESPAVRNLVSHNHIHNIGRGELSDMGAVYTLGESPGTKIINNVIHDVESYGYGGWGLYTDEGSTGIVMRDNLVLNCKSGGFHQHYGRENIIENNIFAFCRDQQLQLTRAEAHQSFRFRHNIILQSEGKTIEGPWEKANIDMGQNLYWHTDGSPRFGNHDFKEWERLKDHGSVLADPLFFAPAFGDFRFRSNAAIKKIDFRPFDYLEAGVYGSEEWKKQAM